MGAALDQAVGESLSGEGTFKVRQGGASHARVIFGHIDRVAQVSLHICKCDFSLLANHLSKKIRTAIK